MRNNRFNNRKEELHKINGNIRAREVRLVGDNVEQGVYTINEALRLADDLELDLVEISPTADRSYSGGLTYILKNFQTW